MSSITNPLYQCTNEYAVEQIENNTMSDNFFMNESYESINFKQNSDHCLSIKSTCSSKNVPDIAVNDSQNTLILITTDIDTELQIVAKRFVEKLLLQAQKEVNAKLAEKNQVLFKNVQTISC